MAYDEKLAIRIREELSSLKNIEEKKMMGGLTFMYNDKMCVGIFNNQLMCRIDPEVYEQTLKQKGCHVMAFAGRVMKGWVLIDESGIERKNDLQKWINLALDFNKKAKLAKKKKPKI